MGHDYLFVEDGKFGNFKNPGWQPLLLVLNKTKH
tara:strand:- start:1267 stop:1368 length:102 start_codon:yes stop_codon:yes gene_type:complete